MIKRLCAVIFIITTTGWGSWESWSEYYSKPDIEIPKELEVIAQCESGGDYHAINDSSGAYGKYQIIPSTARAFSCNLATKRKQDKCALKIWANGSGRSHWDC